MDRVVEDYKGSKCFKLEVAEGCIDFYHLGFSDCKKKATLAFSGLDLKDIIKSDKEGKKEEDDEREGAKGPDKVGTEQIGIGMAPGTVVKEETMEGIIAKAIIDASIMAIKVAEGRNLVWEDVHKE